MIDIYTEKKKIRGIGSFKMIFILIYKTPEMKRCPQRKSLLFSRI